MTKKMYVLLILICLVNIINFSPIKSTNNSIQDDTVEWYDKITKGANITWKCDDYMIPSGNPPTLGGSTFGFDSILKIKVTQNPTLFFNNLYNNDPPSFFEYSLDGTTFDPSSGGLLEIETLYGFVWPLRINWDNSTTTELQSFLGVYKPTTFNKTYINQVGPHSHLTWMNDTTPPPEPFSITFSVDITTGITNHAQFSNETVHWGWTYNGIEEPTDDEDDDEDDEGESPTKIGWSDVIKKSTVLAWNVTRFNQTGDNPFTIGGTIIKAGDIIQLGLIKNPPTNPQDWMDPEGPPDWIQIFINSNEIDINSIGEEGELFLFVMCPLTYTFANGSVFELKDFFDIFLGEDEDLLDYKRTKVDNTYYNVSWREEWEDEGEIGWVNYDLLSTIQTGITVKLNLEASEGNMTWEFFEDAATVDPEKGTTKEMDSDYSVELDYPPAGLFSPGFGILPLFLAIGLLILRKRTNK